jgi:hypothetical protein
VIGPDAGGRCLLHRMTGNRRVARRWGGCNATVASSDNRISHRYRCCSGNNLGYVLVGDSGRRRKDWGLLGYDYLLTLLPIVIIGSIWRSLSSKRRREEIDQAAPRDQQRSSYQDGPYSPSGDFAALIDAIAAEGRKNRKEEIREDRRKSCREWLTIFCFSSRLALLLSRSLK